MGGRQCKRKAAVYAHPKQLRRLRRTLKRQRPLVCFVFRKIQRKLEILKPDSIMLLEKLNTLLQRARRLVNQSQKDKNKLYALHAPEVSCIGKGKAKQLYDFGVKAGLAVTHKKGLIVGMTTFPGNLFDGYSLAEQIEQGNILTEDHNMLIKQVCMNLGNRGVGHVNSDVQIIHQGK